jgi:hypothetical protein
MVLAPAFSGLPVAKTVASIAQAVQTTLDLFETGLALKRQNLRRADPRPLRRKSIVGSVNGSTNGQERRLVIVAARSTK